MSELAQGTTGQRLRLALGRARATNIGDLLFGAVSGGVGIGILLLFAAVLVILAQEAWPAISTFGLGFLWSDAWNPDGQEFGALFYISGTLMTSAIALLVAVPISLGAAIALSDLLPRSVAAVVGLLIELLAALPSIVFGVWAAVVIAPFVRNLSGGESFGPSILAAGLILAIMILPIITALTRDMIRAVPRTQREAALALGATPWEVTWRVVLPNARGGITAAVMLGLGRAIGETMAVIMVIGNQPRIAKSVFEPGSTIPAVIANEFGDPSGPLHFASLVYLGLILMVLALAINILARILVRRYTRYTAVM